MNLPRFKTKPEMNLLELSKHEATGNYMKCNHKLHFVSRKETPAAESAKGAKKHAA